MYRIEIQSLPGCFKILLEETGMENVLRDISLRLTRFEGFSMIWAYYNWCLKLILNVLFWMSQSLQMEF